MSMAVPVTLVVAVVVVVAGVLGYLIDRSVGS